MGGGVASAHKIIGFGHFACGNAVAVIFKLQCRLFGSREKFAVAGKSLYCNNCACRLHFVEDKSVLLVRLQ